MPRSQCPVNLALELLGDRWSLLVVRDLMFTGRCHFRELLQMDEGISSSVLADRLSRLVRAGLLTIVPDPTHKQKAIYRLTAAGIDLLPVVAELAIWGRRHQPASEELSVHADAFALGGSASITAARDELHEVAREQPSQPAGASGSTGAPRAASAPPASAVTAAGWRAVVPRCPDGSEARAPAVSPAQGCRTSSVALPRGRVMTQTRLDLSAAEKSMNEVYAVLRETERSCSPCAS